MPETMQAIRLTGPVPPDGLIVTEVPIPAVAAGQVRIRVRAFGINESEVTSRKGESGPDFSFPRVLGIEAVGVVDAVGDGVDLPIGQKVATMMGGLGRTIDGSYAEYFPVNLSMWRERIRSVMAPALSSPPTCGNPSRQPRSGVTSLTPSVFAASAPPRSRCQRSKSRPENSVVLRGINGDLHSSGHRNDGRCWEASSVAKRAAGARSPRVIRGRRLSSFSTRARWRAD